MPDIIHDFIVKAPPERVFEMFAVPAGLDRWWTKESSGEPKLDGNYRLYFGAGYDWRARVTKCTPGSEFELQMTDAHEDWAGTKVGCHLAKHGQSETRVLFYHTGWPSENEHWRVSNYCWAMYLRILRRNVEHGETVPYEKRLDA
jgi:uncharacterized protein YndB with AHSA1/START domain